MPPFSCRCLTVAKGGGIHRDDAGELFERLCGTENIFLAWNRFRNGKRSRADVMRYERHLEENLFTLQERLQLGAYRHEGYAPFVIHDPKERLIHKATVEDRIVHQAVVNVIESFFEKRFIHHSYSCRLGKGTHAAVRRLRQFLRQASRNDTRSVHVLKCDIRRFFASVDHRKLLELLGRRISDGRVMQLLANIVASYAAELGKGIPLGNLTSQLFANVYLHELDRFVKFDLREKYYLRYCDDFVIVSADRSRLTTLLAHLASFLRDRVKLTLHPNKISIRTWAQGVDFLGYVLLPHCTVLRTKTVGRMRKRVTTDNLSSYLGLCRHAAAYNLVRHMRNTVRLT